MKFNPFKRAKMGSIILKEVKEQRNKISELKENYLGFDEPMLKKVSLQMVNLALDMINLGEKYADALQKEKLERYKTNLTGIKPKIESLEGEENLRLICLNSIEMGLNIIDKFVLNLGKR